MFDLTKIGLSGKDLTQGNTEEALNNYYDSEDALVEDFNRKAAHLSHEINKFNSQWGFLQTREKANQLNNSLKELMAFQENFKDPQQISRQNQNWLNTTLKLIDEEGGAYSGDLKAQAIDGYLLAEENGIRIASAKIRQEATLVLDKFDAKFKDAVVSGDIGQALEIQQEREATINRLVIEDVYSAKEAEAYLKQSREIYADTILVESLGQNNYTEFSDSQEQAYKDMKQMQTMYKGFFNNASARVKTNWLRRMKYLDEQVNKAAFVDIDTAQREYGNAMQTWSFGGATSKETIEKGNKYIAQLKKAKANGQIKPSSIAKVNGEIEETLIANRLVGDVAKAGAAMNTPGFNIENFPIINKNIPIHEVIKQYGFSPSSPAARLIAEVRQTLPFIEKDNVLSNVETYKFIKRANGEEEAVTNITSATDLAPRIAQERRIDRLMGGTGGISSYSADAFNQFQQYNDPNTEATLEQVIADNPADFLPEVSRHRSKLENVATATKTLEFINRHKQIFNFTGNTLNVIRNDIAYNQNAKSAYSKIYNYIENNYNREVLTEFAEYEGIGRQQIFAAVASYTLRQMSEGLAQEDDSYALLNYSLSDLDSKKPSQTFLQLEDTVRGVMHNLVDAQQLRGKVNVTDSPTLQKNSSEANLTISAFSQRPYGDFNFFSTLRSDLPDLGARNIKPLHETQYAKLKTFVEKQLGDNIVDLTPGRMRLMPYKGSIYKIAYRTDYGNLKPLIDGDNEFILFNTDLLRTGKFKIKKDAEADVLINIIKTSNMRSYR